MAAAGGPEKAGALAGDPRQRLDKWLWFARVIKSRSGAARLVSEGRVRVNSMRVETPSKSVKVGDVLTINLERQVRVLRVVAPGLRRGPYEEAKTLFEDLSSPPFTGEEEDEAEA